MTIPLNEEQYRTANYLAAYAHLLLGCAGRFDDFRKRVNIMLCGWAPHALQLMQFSDEVMRSGRPVLWIHHDAEIPQIPQIGLVCQSGDGVHFVENCMLWKGPRDDRASLIPDSFKLGAYRFDDAVTLRHFRKAPARSFEAAETIMGSTYGELYRIEHEQVQRGDRFELPTLQRAA